MDERMGYIKKWMRGCDTLGNGWEVIFLEDIKNLREELIFLEGNENFWCRDILGRHAKIQSKINHLIKNIYGLRKVRVSKFEKIPNLGEIYWMTKGLRERERVRNKRNKD